MENGLFSRYKQMVCLLLISLYILDLCVLKRGKQSIFNKNLGDEGRGTYSRGSAVNTL